MYYSASGQTESFSLENFGRSQVVQVGQALISKSLRGGFNVALPRRKASAAFETPLRPSFIHHVQLNEQVRLQSRTSNPSIWPKTPLSAYLAQVSLVAMARQIIPQQYGILEHAYRALMPDFPADMYPALVQAGHDHDIRFQNFGIPDFSVRKPHRRLVARPCY